MHVESRTRLCSNFEVVFEHDETKQDQRPAILPRSNGQTSTSRDEVRLTSTQVGCDDSGESGGMWALSAFKAAEACLGSFSQEDTVTDTKQIQMTRRKM